MRKSDFYKYFDPNDPERQEKMFQQYRMVALILMLVVGGLYLAFTEFAPPAPPPDASGAGQTAAQSSPDLTDVDDVGQFIAEVQIGSEISEGASALSLMHSIEVQSAADKNNRGFVLGIPKRISTGAGDQVQTGQPSISVILLDRGQVGDNWIENGNAWWKLKLGPQAGPLPAGLHSYDVMATIPGLPLFSPTGAGALTFPVIPPSSSEVYRSQATIVFPDYAHADTIAARAWIAKVDHEAWPAEDREQVSGALSIRPASGLSKERTAVTFVSPRKLQPWEGIWVEVSW